MSNKEKNEPTSADSEFSETQSSQRMQTCGRCHAHKVSGVKLKGHKRFCRFRNCVCPICYFYLREKKKSARKIAIKRAVDEDMNKTILPVELPPSPLYIVNRKNYSNFHVLTYYTLREICNSGYTALNDPIKVWYILNILNNYAQGLNTEITCDSALTLAAEAIYQVIYYGYSYSPFLTFEGTECYDLSSPRVMRGDLPERQPEGIKLPQYPPQNLLVSPPNSLTSAASTSPFPENSVKSESSTDTFIDPGTESTDPSTESSTHIARELTISEVNRQRKHVESKENRVASEVIERLSGPLNLTIDHRQLVSDIASRGVRSTLLHTQ